MYLRLVCYNRYEEKEEKGDDIEERIEEGENGTLAKRPPSTANRRTREESME